MAQDAHNAPIYNWVDGATRRQAFFRGVLGIPSTPTIVLVSTFVGFGVLARETGFSLSHAIFATATVFALPGQVVLVDQVARGASLAACFFAVMLTAVRLFPLTVSLVPHLKDRQSPRWLLFLISHFVAITVWVEAMRRLPALPKELRQPYFLGFGISLCSTTLVGTVLGYSLAGQVPMMFAAVLLFLTPIYFFLSLLLIALSRADYAAILLGVVLGPLFFFVAPGLDLLLTGLVGGTIAYGGARWLKRKG